MEDFIFRFLEQTSGGAAYAVIFLALMACGLGVPLPEDVLLITGGYLVHQGQATIYLMMLIGYFGILTGDSMIYFAGRRFGSKVGQKPGGLVGRIITPEKRARVQQLFVKQGEKIVFIARFMPGVRAVTYFTAGSVHMKYWHFILFDGVAAMISAPVFVFLGYKFGGELEQLINNVRRGQMRVLVVMGVIVLAYVGWRFWRNRKDKKEAPVLEATLPKIEEAIEPDALEKTPVVGAGAAKPEALNKS